MPLLNLEEAAKRFPNASFTTAVGNPALRAKLTEKAKQFGLVEHSLIHPTVIRSRHVRFGAGVVVCAGSTLTTDIEVGKGVQININCSVSHDCVLGDYATLAPGVHLCGNVHVGRGAYIGAGVVVKNGTPDRPLVIGPGTVVGAGACVTKSWEAGLTVVGVPAAILRQRSCNAT
ncbi:transferase [Bryobacterales bacterium F-183]|nr:transferase [Bryobacterales bacterium F-183]